jgi:hypothetical protein
MADVVKREGGAPTMGQSPFALARGYTFERALFRDEAEALREALKGAGVLLESASGFRDFRLRQNGGPFGTLDEALTATAAFLKDIAGVGPQRRLPSVVAGAVVRIPSGVMLPEAILVIDVLTVTRPEKRPVLTVGEIKTYPDRGGYTDGAELATARALPRPAGLSGRAWVHVFPRRRPDVRAADGHPGQRRSGARFQRQSARVADEEARRQRGGSDRRRQQHLQAERNEPRLALSRAGRRALTE